MKSAVRIAYLLILAVISSGCGQAIEPLPAPGGSWTAPSAARPSLIVPASTLNSRQKLDFWTGFGFFRDPWVVAPASTTARDGLGPLFNAQSCIACHAGGGRGRSLINNPESVSTILRLGVVSGEGEVTPHPKFGSQLQTRATFPINDGSSRRKNGAYYPGEAQIRHTIEKKDVQFKDGTILSLQKLRFELTTLGSDPKLPTMISARIAPSLIGLALLETIPVQSLRALEDPDDQDRNGISGRIHWTKGAVAGRFGWKAGQSSVVGQTATAFAQDLGISNPVVENENCTDLQQRCLAQRDGADPTEGVEITAALFDLVVFFTAHIAPPPAAPSGPEIDDGRGAFTRVGCGNCHTPSHEVLMTGESGAEQVESIWPYTDLLLHDMGRDLADALPEGDAGGSEWRTPPLWGLGRSLKISNETGLLHDGRAQNVAEAIAWHDGEGRQSRDLFLNLKEEERTSLVAFVLAL